MKMHHVSVRQLAYVNLFLAALNMRGYLYHTLDDVEVQDRGLGLGLGPGSMEDMYHSSNELSQCSDDDTYVQSSR
jgi:hypothetical protein